MNCLGIYRVCFGSGYRTVPNQIGFYYTNEEVLPAQFAQIDLFSCKRQWFSRADRRVR